MLPRPLSDWTPSVYSLAALIRVCKWQTRESALLTILQAESFLGYEEYEWRLVCKIYHHPVTSARRVMSLGAGKGPQQGKSLIKQLSDGTVTGSRA
jgi:hypothetical protein